MKNLQLYTCEFRMSNTKFGNKKYAINITQPRLTCKYANY